MSQYLHEMSTGDVHVGTPTPLVNIGYNQAKNHDLVNALSFSTVLEVDPSAGTNAKLFKVTYRDELNEATRRKLGEKGVYKNIKRKEEVYEAQIYNSGFAYDKVQAVSSSNNPQARAAWLADQMEASTDAIVEMFSADFFTAKKGEEVCFNGVDYFLDEGALVNMADNEVLVLDNVSTEANAMKFIEKINEIGNRMRFGWDSLITTQKGLGWIQTVNMVMHSKAEVIKAGDLNYNSFLSTKKIIVVPDEWLDAEKLANGELFYPALLDKANKKRLTVVSTYPAIFDPTLPNWADPRVNPGDNEICAVPVPLSTLCIGRLQIKVGAA